MRALLLVLLLSLVPTFAACQTQAQVASAPKVDTLYVMEYTPLANAVATTGCLGGRIYQAIDMAYIGDSLWTEIVEHEAVHKRQYETHLASHNRACPKTSDPLALLAWEIEAYCETRPIRLARGWTLEAVNEEYIDRMQNQFKGNLPKEHVALLFTLGCP